MMMLPDQCWLYTTVDQQLSCSTRVFTGSWEDMETGGAPLFAWPFADVCGPWDWHDCVLCRTNGILAESRCSSQWPADMWVCHVTNMEVDVVLDLISSSLINLVIAKRFVDVCICSVWLYAVGNIKPDVYISKNYLWNLRYVHPLMLQHAGF